MKTKQELVDDINKIMQVLLLVDNVTAKLEMEVDTSEVFNNLEFKLWLNVSKDAKSLLEEFSERQNVSVIRFRQHNDLTNRIQKHLVEVENKGIGFWEKPLEVE